MSAAHNTWRHHTCKCTHTQTQHCDACTHEYTIHIHMHMHIRTHIRMHIRKHTYTQTDFQAQTKSRTSTLMIASCTRKIHIYIHMYTRTHRQILRHRVIPESYQSHTRVIPESYQSHTSIFMTASCTRKFIYTYTYTYTYTDRFWGTEPYLDFHDGFLHAQVHALSLWRGRVHYSPHVPDKVPLSCLHTRVFVLLYMHSS